MLIRCILKVFYRNRHLRYALPLILLEFYEDWSILEQMKNYFYQKDVEIASYWESRNSSKSFLCFQSFKFLTQVIRVEVVLLILNSVFSKSAYSEFLVWLFMKCIAKQVSLKPYFKSVLLINMAGEHLFKVLQLCLHH